MPTAQGTEVNEMLNIRENVNEEELNVVAGGMVVDAYGLPEYNPSCPWEVVDNNTGALLGMFPVESEACQYGKSFGPDSYNAQEVDVATVLRLRANPQSAC